MTSRVCTIFLVREMTFQQISGTYGVETFWDLRVLEECLMNNGVFYVKTFYENLLVREEQVFPYDAIWIPKVSMKMCFFTWLATR